MKNNIFSKLFAILAIATLSLISNVQAASATFGPVASTNLSSLITIPGAISSITFNNGESSAAAVQLYDAPGAVTTYTQGAYTNATVSVVSTVTTYTNFVGTVERQTNDVLTTTLAPVAQTTATYPKLYIYTIPATSSATITFDPKLNFNNGVLVRPFGTNITMTVIYSRAR